MITNCQVLIKRLHFFVHVERGVLRGENDVRPPLLCPAGAAPRGANFFDPFMLHAGVRKLASGNPALHECGGCYKYPPSVSQRS